MWGRWGKGSDGGSPADICADHGGGGSDGGVKVGGMKSAVDRPARVLFSSREGEQGGCGYDDGSSKGKPVQSCAVCSEADIVWMTSHYRTGEQAHGYQQNWG